MSSAPDLSDRLLTSDEIVIAAQQAPPPQQPQQPVMNGSGVSNAVMIGDASMTSEMLSQPTIAATTSQQQQQQQPQSPSTVNFQPDGSSSSVANQDGTLIVDDEMLQSGQGLCGESSQHYCRDWPLLIAKILGTYIVAIVVMKVADVIASWIAG